MKNLIKMRALSVILALLLIFLVVPARVSAAQPTVNLGTTASFAVLAGTTITNTGPTQISGSLPEGGGNVGLHPGSEFTHQADVTMTGWTVHLADAVALQAKADLEIAYDDAAGRTPFTTISPELGETTLFPGTYRSDSGFQITGTLTLDAQGDPDAVFVFQSGSTLITASGSHVKLIGDARYCRVFWQVTSSATLGTNSYFVGHIFALTSIAAETGATVQGQLLARTGAVTLDSNTIINGPCAVESTPSATATPTPTTAETTASTDTTTASTDTTTTSTGTTTTSTGTTTTSTGTTTTSTGTTTTSTAGTTTTSTAGTTTTSTTDQELPKTGESGPAAIIGFALLSLAGALALILRRKGSR